MADAAANLAMDSKSSAPYDGTDTPFPPSVLAHLDSDHDACGPHPREPASPTHGQPPQRLATPTEPPHRRETMLSFSRSTSMTFAVAAGAAAAAVAVLSSTADAAGSIKVTCVFTNNQCSATPMLRYYDNTNSCTEGMCAPLTVEGKAEFSTIPVCADDILANSKQVLGEYPFVVVQQHKEDGCSSAARNATAVVADGKCYPFIDGKSSYKVEIGKDKVVTWNKFSSSGKCEGAKTTTTFKADETDGKKCMPGRTTVLAYMPSKNTTSMPPKGTTKTPPKDATNMPPNDKTKMPPKGTTNMPSKMPMNKTKYPACKDRKA